MPNINMIKNFSSIDVAKHYLVRTNFDGDLISPLKMQKLVYYAYAWSLVKGDTKLFDEKLEAWPNGPVFPNLYHELKGFGASPISTDIINDEGAVEKKISDLPEKIRQIIDYVYDKYSALTAFELVTLTHNESPWRNARKGLEPTDTVSNQIKDEDILKEYK